MLKYLPAIICLAVLAYKLLPVLLNYWREWQAPPKPIWLRYRPTGKVLYFPAHYESDAIDELLRGLDEIPEGVPLSSPLFERPEAPPTDAKG